jgi:hypothetical protein
MRLGLKVTRLQLLQGLQKIEAVSQMPRKR